MIVYKYGLMPTTHNAEVVEEQLKLTHHFLNCLIRNEIERRRLIREAEEPYGIRPLEGSLKELYIKIEKMKDKDEDKKVIAQVNREISKVRATLKELRETPELKARILEINGKEPKVKVEGEKRSTVEARKDKTPNNGIAAKMAREIYNSSKAFTYSKVNVGKSYQQIVRTCGKIYDGTEDNDPKFRRWDGGGQLAFQIQCNSRSLDIFNDDRVRINPVDEIALTSPVRSERRKAARTTLRMAVAGRAKGKNNKYTFAEWPMIMHRPLPNGAVIKWVRVSRVKIGSRFEWSCEIVIDTTMPRRKEPGEGTLSVVFGWKAVEKNKIRVAQWLASTGETGVLDLSRDGLDLKIKFPKGHCEPKSPYTTDCDRGRGGVIRDFRKVDEINGIRTKKFNKARAEFVKWLRTLPEVPEWIRARTTKGERIPTSKQAIAYIEKWQSILRFVALIKEWRSSSNRIQGDEGVFAASEKWRYNDFHLWQWEKSQCKSTKRRRNNIYRVTASQLVDKYSQILVDGTNFKDMREKEEKEENVSAKQGRRAQSMAQIVSPGIFRDCFENAAKQRGKTFNKPKVEGSAQKCPRCGLSHKANKHGDDGMFACGSCGLTREIAMIRLMNMLRDDGNDVSEIIRRQDEVVEKLERLRDGY